MMLFLWSVIVAAVALLGARRCAGESSCVLWSSAGDMVQRGSSFEVYCTFNPTCKRSRSMRMCADGSREEEKLTYKQFNETTIFLRVEKITEKRTYSCLADCNPPKDSCGLDISAGYPPERPKNISCIYRILTNDTGSVNCSWHRGRVTYLRDRFTLWVQAVSGNHSGGAVPACNVSNKGTDLLSAIFTLPTSVRFMSVWVQASNPLGSIESSVVNYTLRDIVMPSTPAIDTVECSSRNCTIKVEQPVRKQHLQVQYRDVEQQEWRTYAEPVGLMIPSKTKHISSLEPCSLYSFRVRSRFSTGLWSQWSSSISNQTEEEAPTPALDVWLVPVPGLKSMRVYWKVSVMAVCSRSITQYKIQVNSNDSVVANVGADVKNRSIPFCSNCEVSVQAVNSKGLSPPATITTHHTDDVLLAKTAPLEIESKAENHTVTISWRKPQTAPAHYLVEWFSEGLMLNQLRWVRLNSTETFIKITDMNPYECYEGAVYVFYNKSSVSKTSFGRIATLEAAPEMGPSVQEKVEGKQRRVTVVWTELPKAQRRGCITSFTIYLQNRTGAPKLYYAQASEREKTIEGLHPDSYSLWMSASTSKGEGPPGQKIKFFIEEDDHLSPLLMMCLLVTAVAFTLCLWKGTAVKHRFSVIFRCLMPDVVPDPANSKWARECSKEKGMMNLKLPSHDSSFTDPEDETILVDVEELCRQIGDPPAQRNNPLKCSPESTTGQETELSALMYPPLTTYIKSLSHDSDSSCQISSDTSTIIDYISSHGQENLENYDQDDEEFPEMQFFPSLSLLMEPVGCGGKLTLDAVKIDCSDFFQNA
ncbi:interleukin-12 receptor subunit beta-2 [Cyprinodon tularosa]|uniref:interleukin-12 receptor subunit beta-2 n=1 Tax=Cyprinodon tularosa TaxID=77115 RepID=UPI0018E1E65C|nr:interleukin-12 receptor subunit beta-2 [Cyprinodon tularosa]